MREDILPKLRCPGCRQAAWALLAEESDGREIREGRLSCRRCGSTHPVHRGIVDLLPPGGAVVEAEVKGWEEVASAEGWLTPPDDYLLSLPRPRQPISGDNLSWEVHAANFDLLLAELSVEGAQVLDVGAGRCWSTRDLAGRGAACVAMDVLPHPGIGLGAAEVQMQRAGLYFERVLGDMTEMPFVDASFDLVFSTGAIHHSTSLGGTMAEAFRLLRPGGCLAVTNEACGACFSRERRYSGSDPSQIHEHNYRLVSYRRALRLAGFSRVRLIPDVTWRTGRTRSWKLRWATRMCRALPGQRIPFLLKQSLFGGPLLFVATK